MVRRVHIQCIIAGCGHQFLNGMAVAWATPIVPKLLDIDQTPFGHVLSQSKLAILHFTTLSYLFAVIIAGTVADKFGRKTIFFSGAIIRTLLWLATSFNTNMDVLFAIKVIEAQIMGLSYPTAVLYMSEVIPAKIRGLAMTLLSFFLNLGILIIYAVGPFVSYRTVALVMTGFCSIILLNHFFVPESPTYFIMKGRKQEASKSLKILNGLSFDAENHVEDTLIMLNSDKNIQNRNICQELRELFCIKKNIKAFTIAFVVFLMPEMSGIMPYLFNMTSIFAAAGSSVPPHIASIIVAGIQLVPCIMSSMLVERVGRRKLILTSTLVTTIANCAMGVLFYLDAENSPIVKSVKWLPLVIMIFFITFYWIGLGTIPGAMLAELLDTRIKALGSSLISTIVFGMIIVLVSVFNVINTYCGYHMPFWIFAACGLAGFVFIYLFLPETRGKTLLEIQELLD